MTEEFIEKLKSYGFERYLKNCELLDAFRKPAYYYDSKMIVAGAHSSENADIIYVEEDDFKGLTYASSLMEVIMIDYPTNHNIQKIVKQVAKITDTEIEFRSIGAYPMVVSACDETDFDNGEIKYHISDMLKVIGALDYLLQKRDRYLLNKRIKSNKTN